MNPDLISIDVKNVTKRLGPNLALNGLAAHFESGTLHGVIGPDGAGKTTLMRMLMGLLKPSEGEIVYYSGKDPVPFSEVRPLTAYMPQQQSLYADLSCSEHLDFFRDLYQIPQEVYGPRREELLKITRLEKFQDRAAGKLSGGMYKKLGLMCSLLQSPKVLLLDEPTNGVDPISRREFWDLLYRLKEQKILIIMATAYMDEAERCDSVLLLNRGEKMIQGEPRFLLESDQASNFQDLFLKRVAGVA